MPKIIKTDQCFTVLFTGTVFWNMV